MRLKLDENISRGVRTLFESGGHDVCTVADEGLSSSPDGDVFSAARSEQRCLVTLDLDFANPVRFSPVETSGIAVLRLPRKPVHRDLLDASRTLVAALERGSIAGKLWIVEVGRIREYQPNN